MIKVIKVREGKMRRNIEITKTTKVIQEVTRKERMERMKRVKNTKVNQKVQSHPMSSNIPEMDQRTMITERMVILKRMESQNLRPRIIGINLHVPLNLIIPPVQLTIQKRRKEVKKKKNIHHKNLPPKECSSQPC